MGTHKRVSRRSTGRVPAWAAGAALLGVVILIALMPTRIDVMADAARSIRISVRYATPAECSGWNRLLVSVQNDSIQRIRALTFRLIGVDPSTRRDVFDGETKASMRIERAGEGSKTFTTCLPMPPPYPTAEGGTQLSVGEPYVYFANGFGAAIMGRAP